MRRGSQGPHVVWLQQALRRRGYDPGDIDGRFGFLTEDALRELQADYGLRPDGVAGPQVRALLTAPRPVPLRRIVYRARGRVPLAYAAEQLGVSPAYLARVNGARSRSVLEPGMTVSAFPRWLLLRLDGDRPGLGAARLLERYGSRITGVIDGRTPQDGAGPWPGDVVGWIDLPWDLTAFAAAGKGKALGRPGEADEGRERVEQVLEAARGGQVRGLHVHRGPVPWGQGGAWARGAAALSRRLWRHGLTLLVTVAVPDPRRVLQRVFGDFHWDRWVPLTEAVIVPGPDPGGSDTFARWYARLEAARPFLPLWKCVAGLDLRAVERDGKGRLLRRLSHQQAMALCRRRRIRPVWDDRSGCSRATYEEGGQPRHLYMWTRRTVAGWLERVRVWGLAGVCLNAAAAGEERFVEEALLSTAVLRHVEPVPGIKLPEGEGGSSR